jgi:hypothetical protein
VVSCRSLRPFRSGHGCPPFTPAHRPETSGFTRSSLSHLSATVFALPTALRCALRATIFALLRQPAAANLPISVPLPHTIRLQLPFSLRTHAIQIRAFARFHDLKKKLLASANMESFELMNRALKERAEKR